MLPFYGLSVWTQCTFVHCLQTAEDIDMISFAYDCPCFSKIVLKFGYIGQSLPPQILPQSDPPPVDLSTRHNSMANCNQMQWSQWRTYRKPPLLFWMVPWLIPYNLPFPQNCGQFYWVGSVIMHLCLHVYVGKLQGADQCRSLETTTGRHLKTTGHQISQAAGKSISA